MRGRGVHEQHAHKNWRDDKLSRELVHKKKPWTDEESLLLARREASLVIAGERFINQALMPFFPGRTLESIKGHRRTQQYKSSVLGYVEELTMRGPAPTDPDAAEGGGDPLDAIREYISSLEPLDIDGYNADRLNAICGNVRAWTPSQIAEHLEVYLLDIFPLSPPKGKQHPRQPRTIELSRRQARRVEFGRTQRAWRKDPCATVRSILDQKSIDSSPNIAKDKMEPYWRKIMEGGASVSPGIDAPSPVIGALLVPITDKEIREAFPKLSTSPGPDGVSSRLLRATPIGVLERVFNLLLLGGRLPRHLSESRTILIPKKDQAADPSEFRPITVSSVITRAFHKVLAARFLQHIKLDDRQRAFRPLDGSAMNIFDLDLLLHYHRQQFRPLYLASIDVAKAFDSVSHGAIKDVLVVAGVPGHLVAYIADVYDRSLTSLSFQGWTSEAIHPTCGVKQGDPLSPIIFNLVVDGLLKRIPREIGVDVEGVHYSALGFADDLMFFASTPVGLQQTLDIAAGYLGECGLNINAAKSFTVAIRNLPHVKKVIVDRGVRFHCGTRELPALRRQDEWRFLGVPFTPEGRSTGREKDILQAALSRLTSAPLKPQQRMFALRVVVLPSLYHLMTLGCTTISKLNRVDTLVRAAIRKWLGLPRDVVRAYFHAPSSEGGLSIPSMRWLMPLHRKLRLQRLSRGFARTPAYLALEIDRSRRRLMDQGQELESAEHVKRRWTSVLHSSFDGKPLRESKKVPQQHQWIVEGTRLLSGSDFVNMSRLRINAMPTKSRTSRGRIQERLCRAGCNEVETLNHILQRCHRTHDARIERHNTILSYIQRGLQNRVDRIELEPQIPTPEGIRKPDLLAITGKEVLVLDAQVISEHTDLDEGHVRKIDYYKKHEGIIRERYKANKVLYTTVTLNTRGVWSKRSADDLVGLKALKRSELKIVSIKTLCGGLNAFWKFNRRTTNKPRTGVG